MTVPGVLAAAVVGLPDDHWGDRVHAVISGAASLDGEAVLAMCKDKLAGYKMPKAVEVWEELPKSTAGKILRRVVRDQIIAREAAKKSEV